MTSNDIALAVMAVIGALLLGIGVLSSARSGKRLALANCIMILTGVALLAVVAGAQPRAQHGAPAHPSIRYDPKRYPPKPYPIPELFRKEQDRSPKYLLA